MKSTKLKTEKGITLIALIITIVVLLILAVVAINSIRNDGIISHAQNTTKVYAEAQEKESIQLAIYEWLLVKDDETEKTFAEFLEEKLGASNVVDNGDDTYNVTVESGNIYKVQENGTIVKELSILKVGSYVEYDVSYTDMYSGTAYTSTNGWRYLGTETDSEGKTHHLLISTAIPVVLYYHSSTAGENAKWWDTDTTLDANVRATNGMLNNLDKIPFAQKASGTSMSSGEENTAIGRFAGTEITVDGTTYTAIGDYFKSSTYSSKIENVRTLTLAELNRAVNSATGGNRAETDTSSGFKDLTDEALGLFDMQDLTDDYTAGYQYWLASPITAGNYYVYRMYVVNASDSVVNHHTDFYYGVRPVVVLSSDSEIVDLNEDGLFEIQ